MLTTGIGGDNSYGRQSATDKGYFGGCPLGTGTLPVAWWCMVCAPCHRLLRRPPRSDSQDSFRKEPQKDIVVNSQSGVTENGRIKPFGLHEHNEGQRCELKKQRPRSSIQFFILDLDVCMHVCMTLRCIVAGEVLPSLTAPRVHDGCYVTCAVHDRLITITRTMSMRLHEFPSIEHLIYAYESRS